MFLKLVTIFLLVGLSTSGVNAECGVLGPPSNVKCVTKTEFVLAFQDDDLDPMINQCPNGTVCANHQSVCISASLEADCTNEVVDGGACNDCRDRGNNEPVCVSKTEYALCKNKEVDVSRTIPCASPGICKAGLTDTVVTSICSTKPKDFADCPAPAIPSTTDAPPTVPPPTVPPTSGPETGCIAEGFYPDTSVAGCQKYIKCTKGAGDTFITESFSCNAGYVFNAATKKCVPESTYECPGGTIPPVVPETGCKAEGFFPDTSGAGCQKYIKCTKGAGDTFISESFSCTAGFNFNATTKRCVPQSAYPCPAA